MATLMDLRATFNSMTEEQILGKRLEKEGISKRMREMIIEIHDETRNVMKVREEHREKF